MSQVIRITDQLFKRLEKYAQGFDTPAKVIEKILDAYEGVEPIESDVKDVQQSNHLELVFYDGNEEAFKSAFLSSGLATVEIFYTDGSTETFQWQKNNFTERSSAKGNLMSGRLRGWKEKGIVKAVVKSEKS
jgi:hypothetical protein